MPFSKKLISVFIVLICLFSAFKNEKNKRLTVFIIGDSTASNKEEKVFPETGWGMKLGSFLQSDIKVDNRALNGRSTKSFINEKRWEAVLNELHEGDFVLIQFGHNDEKVNKPTVGTSLLEFKSNLIKFINETQSKAANPVLLTPIVRRNFKNGILVDTHQGYPDVVRKVADSLHIPLIDLQKTSEMLLINVGEEPSKKLFNYVEPGHINYPDGNKDDTHLSPEGARQIAALVTQGFIQSKILLADFLIKDK